MTQAMRARMQETLPDNATKKIRFMWNRVRQPMLEPPDLSPVLCGLCWATECEYCPCGAEMVGSHDAKALADLHPSFMRLRIHCCDRGTQKINASCCQL